MDALSSFTAVNSVRNLWSADVEDPRFIDPELEIIPNPTGQDIAIRRVLTRIHVHDVKAQGSIYELAFVLARISDGSIVGGSVIDSSENVGIWERTDERDYTPNYWLLGAGDGLIALHQYFNGVKPGIQRGRCVAGFFAQIAYAPAPRPKFVSTQTVPGNPTTLIGLKDDGTFWATPANARPLAWTLIS